MTPQEQERYVRFLALDELGWTQSRIAADLGVSIRTVHRWRHRSGRLRLPPPVKRPLQDHVRARELLSDGCPVAEVVRTVGVADATVRRWFPGVRGLSRIEAGELSVIRQMEKRLIT